MNRSLNVERVLIFVSIPVALLIVWLVGRNTAVWVFGDYSVRHILHPVILQFLAGFFFIAALVLSCLVLALIGLGGYLLFDWLYPKREE